MFNLKYILLFYVNIIYILFLALGLQYNSSSLDDR